MPGFFDKIPEHFIGDPQRSIRRLPLEVFSAGSLHKSGVVQFCLESTDKPFQLERGAQPHHLVYVILEGTFVGWTPEGGEFEFGRGDVMIVRAGQLRQVVMTSKSMHLVFLWLKDIPEWSSLVPHCARHFPINWYKEFEYLFEAFSVESTTDNDERMQELYSLQLLRLLRRFKGNRVTQNTNYAWKLKKLWAEVSAQPHADWHLDLLAEKMHLSVVQLYRVVMDEEGIAPMSIIRRIRLEQAAQLLQHSNDTIERIAQMVGYSSAYSFSRAFTQHFGKRPGKWRIN